MSKIPVVMCWSGGKDSALALHALLSGGDYEPVALLTTVTGAYDRISMHGVRRELLHMQAEALALPLTEIIISVVATNEEYETKMRAACMEFLARGVETFAFGDLFLQDIRAYRDRMLAAVDMRAVYPIWGRDTAQLARDFIQGGFGAVLCCVDPRQLDERFAGRRFDCALLADLPASVDPCGENGEFHTFVDASPDFKEPIPCHTGEIVLREGFVFCDLLPQARKAA